MNLKPLSPLELVIMRVVWQLKRATVRNVYEVMLQERKIAYTTVMTVMNKLEKKRYLKKVRQDRAYLYHPSKPQEQVIRSMVQEFVTRVFNGSAKPLMLYLVKDRKLSEKDLREIFRLMEEKP
jgi:BlaI family penicillinase repressor